MRRVLAIALSIASLCACANAQPRSAADDTCAVLRLGAAALAGRMSLTDPERTTLRGITTTPLSPPTYRCGEESYQTNPRELGTTFTAIGFNAERRYAALRLQSVAGPLAGAGYACLYQRQGESWTLRGCEVNWVS